MDQEAQILSTIERMTRTCSRSAPRVLYGWFEEGSAFGIAGIVCLGCLRIVHASFRRRMELADVARARYTIVPNVAAHALALDHPYLLSFASALTGYVVGALFEAKPMPMVVAAD